MRTEMYHTERKEKRRIENANFPGSVIIIEWCCRMNGLYIQLDTCIHRGKTLLFITRWWKIFIWKYWVLGVDIIKAYCFRLLWERRKINKFIKNETIRCLLQSMLYLSRFSYAILYNAYCLALE